MNLSGFTPETVALITEARGYGLVVSWEGEYCDDAWCLVDPRVPEAAEWLWSGPTLAEALDQYKKCSAREAT